MPYQIKYTDYANKAFITIEDGIINTDTSLQIPGKSTTAYGSAIAENFLHLLENFASATAPGNPVEGQLWYDSTGGAEQLKVYNGANWVAANAITKSATQPTITQPGDLWVDSNNSQLYLYTEANGWILIGPEFSQGLLTGATPKVLAGTDDVNYNVLQIDISGKPAAIISTQSFIPKIKIDGFSQINPGYNLTSANVAGAGTLKYLGAAEKAENLIVGSTVVAASNFLRADAVSSSSYALNMRTNAGINFGINNELNIGIEGNAGSVTHNIAGSSIDFKVKNDGLLKNILRLDSGMRVGINTVAPDETLHVTGNVKLSPISTDTTSGKLSILGVTDSTSINTGALIVSGGAGVAKNMHVGDNLTVGFVAGDYVADRYIKAEKIVPGGNERGTIGTTTLKYNSIYSKKFYGDVEGNVTGTITGVAGSANRLASSTTFAFAGDMTLSTDLVFNGQGGTSTFNTQVSNDFIANKASVTETQGDDEILLNRVSLSTGIKKVQVQNLLKAVPTMPVGVILPYGAIAAPTGWLLCDGSEVQIANYTLLYNLIGFTFKAENLLVNGTGYFALPDLRGRMALGLDNMRDTTNPANTVSAANTLGAASGSASRTLSINNLPQHQHNLQSSEGQHYAIREATPGNDANLINFNKGTTADQARGLGNSGNIDTSGTIGQAVDLMNPYLALTYIIYHGQAT